LTLNFVKQEQQNRNLAKHAIGMKVFKAKNQD